MSWDIAHKEIVSLQYVLAWENDLVDWSVWLLLFFFKWSTLKITWDIDHKKMFLSSMDFSVCLKTTNGKKMLGTLITRNFFLFGKGLPMFLYMVKSRTSFPVRSMRKWLRTLTTRKWFISTIGFLCVFKLPAWENNFEHWSQINGFSPLWVLLCVFNSSAVENDLQH